MLLAVEVEHELDERVLQSRPFTLREVESAARDLRAAVEIENFEFLAEIVVRDDWVGKVPQVVEPPPIDFDVVGLVVADRGVRMWNVWEFEQRGFEFRFQLVGAGFEFLEFRFQFTRAFDRGLGFLVRSVSFEFADLLRDLVSLASQVVPRRLEAAPLVVDFENPVEIDVDAFRLERASDLGWVFPDELPR